MSTQPKERITHRVRYTTTLVFDVDIPEAKLANWQADTIDQAVENEIAWIDGEGGHLEQMLDDGTLTSIKTHGEVVS